MENLNNQNLILLNDLTTNELENIHGGSITLAAAAIYAGCAAGGFVAGVGVTVGTVKFLNWIGA